MRLNQTQHDLLKQYVDTCDPTFAIELGKNLLTSTDALLRILGQTWIEVGERELKNR